MCGFGSPNGLILKESAVLSITVALFHRFERATTVLSSPTRLATVTERIVIILRTSVKGHSFLGQERIEVKRFRRPAVDSFADCALKHLQSSFVFFKQPESGTYDLARGAKSSSLYLRLHKLVEVFAQKHAGVFRHENLAPNTDKYDYIVYHAVQFDKAQALLTSQLANQLTSKPRRPAARD